jgi:hypothetical protein
LCYILSSGFYRQSTTTEDLIAARNRISTILNNFTQKDFDTVVGLIKFLRRRFGLWFAERILLFVLQYLSEGFQA